MKRPAAILKNTSFDRRIISCGCFANLYSDQYPLSYSDLCLSDSHGTLTYTSCCPEHQVHLSKSFNFNFPYIQTSLLAAHPFRPDVR